MARHRGPDTVDARQMTIVTRPPLRYRTLWISDLHLGTPGCQARALLDFLKHTECETLFLVGDIIDGWQLRRQWYWPQAHNDVIQKLLRKARKGTRVIFVPGNHDEFARKYINHNFGGIEVAEEWVHETADGRKLWVIHGDLFDGVIQCAKWLAHVGDSLYEFTLKLNRHLNSLRARMGLPYWSLSKYLKLQGEARRELRGRLRERRGARGAQARRCRAWCAATSTTPRCATSTASCTATTAIGWKASRRWPSTPTARWKSLQWAQHMPVPSKATPAREAISA
jgi:UDP-2,3-diacylglucosamine pyrophosphatase LpxH